MFYLNLMQGTASMICLCASVIVVHLLVGEEWLNDILPSQSKSTRTLAATGPRALRGTLRVLVSLNQGVGGAGWWTWATTV